MLLCVIQHIPDEVRVFIAGRHPANPNYVLRCEPERSIHSVNALAMAGRQCEPCSTGCGYCESSDPPRTISYYSSRNSTGPRSQCSHSRTCNHSHYGSGPSHCECALWPRRTQPKRIRKVDRIAVRKPVQIEPAGQPDRILLREEPSRGILGADGRPGQGGGGCRRPAARQGPRGDCRPGIGSAILPLPWLTWIALPLSPESVSGSRVSGGSGSRFRTSLSIWLRG